MALRQSAVESRDPRLIARALARQARYKFDTGLGSHIERDVNAAVRSARRASDSRAEAEARRVLALYLGQRGRYAEALVATDHALEALDTRNAAQPPPGGVLQTRACAARTLRIEVLLTRGALFRQTGEIDRAIEMYAEAYALLARFGPSACSRRCSTRWASRASRGDYEDSLTLYRSSIAAQRETGQRDRLGIALSNAGQAYAAIGRRRPGDGVSSQGARRVLSVGDARSGQRRRARGARRSVRVALGHEAALAELELARRVRPPCRDRRTTVLGALGRCAGGARSGRASSGPRERRRSQRLANEAGISEHSRRTHGPSAPRPPRARAIASPRSSTRIARWPTL